LTWIMWNSGLAAVGALLAFSHPLTILVTFVTAPIGTLSPVLAVGFFAAICEATVRKPKVEDFENLPTDVTSIRGFWKNRVTRTILVFFLSSLGGMAGNWIFFFIQSGRLLHR